jgi:hypothetical protein
MGHMKLKAPVQVAVQAGEEVQQGSGVCPARYAYDDSIIQGQQALIGKGLGQ